MMMTAAGLQSLGDFRLMMRRLGLVGRVAEGCGSCFLKSVLHGGEMAGRQNFAKKVLHICRL